MNTSLLRAFSTVHRILISKMNIWKYWVLLTMKTRGVKYKPWHNEIKQTEYFL